MLHRMHSVGAQIHYDLVEVGRMSQQVRRWGSQSHLEPYALGQRERDPLECLLDNALDANGDPRIRFGAAQSEQLLGQYPGMRTGLEYIIDVTVRFTRS
jgi:hypothetical protein